MTELRKCEFEEATIGQLNANIIDLASSTTDGGTVWIDDKTVELVSLDSSNISTLDNKLTEIENKIVRFYNKVSADTLSKYNDIKVEFDNNKFNQTIINIQLGYVLVDISRGLRENHISMMGMVIKYIIAILLEGKLVDNKE